LNHVFLGQTKLLFGPSWLKNVDPIHVGQTV